MNFLSHYYFERYSHDPELVLGSVLPDLIKNADKALIVHPQKYVDRFGNNPKMQSLYRGWVRHVETDRYFHNSAFFYTHTHDLKVQLAPAVEGTPIRPSFLSHIALELLLDHLLLRDNLVHESDFYTQLALADRQTTDRFLKRCEVRDTTVFFAYLDRFIAARYIGEYREFSQITLAMLSICRRLWDVWLHADQEAQITDTISAYVKKLDRHYHSIFDEIGSKLS